jgi:hypothetical protein
MLQLKFWNLSNIVSTTILQFVSTDLEQVVIFFKPTYTSVQLISLCPYSLIQKSLLSLLLSANFFNFIACEIREFEEREREHVCMRVCAHMTEKFPFIFTPFTDCFIKPRSVLCSRCSSLCISQAFLYDQTELGRHWFFIQYRLCALLSQSSVMRNFHIPRTPMTW